jgi:Tetratricopeptide repeat
MKSSLFLSVTLLLLIPVLGCASAVSDRSTVVDVTSRQTAMSGQPVEVAEVEVAAATVAENDAERDQPGVISRITARDSDGDGIPDDEDQCPDHPEDRDGFQDSDGCADPDNDADGILDVNDKCPNVPETMNGFEDGDGCPDANIDRAKLAFREGATAYAQGDYVKARRYFEEAFNLEPRDMLLFNIAQVSDKQGDRQHACLRYRQWRSSPSGSSSSHSIPTLETCP